MMEMKIKIEVPELAVAIEKLAGAIDKTARGVAAVQETPAASAVPVSGTAAPAVVPAPTVTAPTLTVAPTVTASTVTASTPTPAVPVTAPTYTLDQIAKAGASLVDAGKMEQLFGLLTKYGVQAVTQLVPDQYGAFATELRALGAQL